MKIDYRNNVPALLVLVRVFLANVKVSIRIRAFIKAMLYAVVASLGLSFSVVAQENVSAQNTSSERADTLPSILPSSADASQTSPQIAPQSVPQATDVVVVNPHPQTTSDWLMQLSEVVKTQNFEVAFVQSRAGRETIPFLWRHGVLEDGTSMEQLNLQNGPGREQIRVNGIVSVFEPDVSPYSLRSEFINGPIPSELLHHPDRLKSGYEFVSVGRARVAGRPAQQIRIVSRDNSRFSYQLWLDEDSGMVLKLNMLDLQGGLLEQIQVTSLKITDAPDDYFARINQASLPKPMALTQKQSRQPNWEVKYLPNGMEEVRGDTRRLALTGQVVEYKMYSDGLVDVSVYVQPAKDALGGDLVLRNDLSTFLTLTDGNTQVTVVGEIPLQTANAIATSLSPMADK
ncbi:MULTISPECIES: MucB/RseB C-terminal domain-containing protein [Alteromonas]|jgi:sigma-E factor negative regulatory protein RseB|uniref:Anti sigma E (Sigma 24) factor, negative regulator n=1 Tax=Alteromonas naphthalenivorans TaxID=715451 RepID=F5ZC85_ALTNA|nr:MULTISPECIES: MucB/RseB C-terminal domain-containing protein [Alteromonas]AEF02403.1 putative anti sigma E (sigma 24) factor, negative regulator [Alteromonas naphthalenivorans]|tara:strand:- start:116 stop:1318 length:1203 start_codon:yes stop_codon:yes gene_type:complete